MERLNKSHRMSQIVMHGDTIYLAGQVCKDDTQDMKGQTQSVLDKIDAHLESVGSNKSKLLMVQIFVSDMSLVGQMNEAWDAWVDQNDPPARACVQAPFARPELLVEMVATAAI